MKVRESQLHYFLEFILYHSGTLSILSILFVFEIGCNLRTLQLEKKSYLRQCNTNSLTSNL